MDTNVYNLIWQSYPDHLREMMQNMMQADNFTDVTLVTDDKKSIKAHRNILSACSPVLNNILKLHSQPNHPIIYLRGIQYSEMESILQFIYQGEARFAEYRLNEFLSVSQSLEIKQLSKNAVVENNFSDPVHEGGKEKSNVNHQLLPPQSNGQIIIHDGSKIIFNEENSNYYKCPLCENNILKASTFLI